MWIDTHCHLQLDERRPEELLERAPQVDSVVVPGVDAASSRAALALAESLSPRVVATAGLHPHDAERWPAERAEIIELAGRGRAVGEVGLDFYRNLAPRAAQLSAFGDQLDLAADLGLPVIVHCRDAFADVFRMIEGHAARTTAILHCWTGGPRWTRRFLDLDTIFSFAGPVAFATGDTARRGAALVPPDRALVETDTPYLAPPPHRQEPNEPAWVALVGAALGRVWGMDDAAVAAATSANARQVFGL